MKLIIFLFIVVAVYGEEFLLSDDQLICHYGCHISNISRAICNNNSNYWKCYFMSLPLYADFEIIGNFTTFDKPVIVYDLKFSPISGMIRYAFGMIICLMPMLFYVLLLSFNLCSNNKIFRIIYNVFILYVYIVCQNYFYILLLI